MSSTEDIPLATASLGTERHLTVHRFGRPGARPKAYLHAALHAAELPGIVVLDHLLERLEAAEAEGRVNGEIVVVPFANPIGMAQQMMGEAQGRFDYDTSGNYNRSFPDLAGPVGDRVEGKLGADGEANRATIRAAIAGALAEQRDVRETAALKCRLLELSADADIVLDLHSAWEALLHVFVTGPHWPEAEDLARQMRCEVVLVDRGNPRMTFKSAHVLLWRRLAERFPENPVPSGPLTAVVELRGQRDVDDHLTRPDADNLFHFLMRRGLVDGNPGPLPALATEPRSVTGLTRMLAPARGILVYHRALGDHVARGEAFCDIVDPECRTRVPVVARQDGLLYARRSHRYTRKGQYICAIAGDVPVGGAA